MKCLSLREYFGHTVSENPWMQIKANKVADSSYNLVAAKKWGHPHGKILSTNIISQHNMQSFCKGFKYLQTDFVHNSNIVAFQ